MTIDDEDAARYPRAWGKRPTYVRIKLSTFVWMSLLDCVGGIFIILVLLGV